MIVEPQEQVLPVLPIPNVQPHSYTIVPGKKTNTEIICDDLGFMYHKNKITENKIYLVCFKRRQCCRATAVISSNRQNNSIVFSRKHNHQVKPYDMDVPFL
ncbi:unnamed protein product [Aphis gossypii]|uniref:FLYWCH-type domain-containing protein n=1 Tax=Aphis gossypii TaxID=80765 RepID=A0A9P0J5D0_APHGO|nr:unnamed protein product [Aphis gossypii]